MKPFSRGHAYALEVLADDSPHVTGELVKAACRRFLRDLDHGRERGLVFDLDAAEHALAWWESCPHTKGRWARQPIELEGWQCFIVENLYGWVWEDTGLRRFRTGYIRVARKQGKTTLAAPSGSYALFMDGEEGAEVYSGATTRPQAAIVGEQIGRMLRLMEVSDLIPEGVSLEQRFDGTILEFETASKFQPLAADSKKLDGLNPSHAILDELHEHPDSSLWDIIETGMGARSQPMMIGLTTAGETAESFCGEFDQRAAQVVQGSAEDDRLFAYIAAPDPEDDWTHPDTWKKANPNLGVSVQIEDLEALCKEAQERPIKQVAFRRYRCNQFVAARSAFISDTKWAECHGGVTAAEIAETHEGDLAYVGIDLSQTTDLSSMALVFPSSEADGPVDVLWRNYIPEIRLTEATGPEALTLQQLAASGDLSVIPGAVIDQDWIEEDLRLWAENFQLERVGYDPWAASQFAKRCEDSLLMVEVRQGYKTMSEPTKYLEALVLQKRVRHGGNAVARWAISNLAVAHDPAGNVKPEKGGGKGTKRKRIDPIVALIIALEQMMRGEADATPPSVYQTGDELLAF